MYSINVKVQTNVLAKFDFDKFLEKNFADYKIREYAKNENLYSATISNSVETTDISKTITEISDILDQIKDFHKDFIEVLAYEISAYEKMPETPRLFPATKAKADKMMGIFKKASLVADIMIKKANMEKKK